MFCDITYPDGSVFDGDTRALLKKTVEESAARGISFQLGTEIEFYLFKQDENGESTLEPIDTAGYMDIAAEDKGENVRREICLTLEQMGIHPEASHHESGPGQNEIDFRYAPALTLTTRKIRAEVGRRYHSEGLSSSQVSIALGNTPAVAKRHYRTLSPRDEAELYHRRYTTYFAVPPTREATTPHLMWGSCDSSDCQHRGHCHICPYLYTTEAKSYVPCTKSS